MAAHLPAATVARIRELRYEDGLTAREVAERVGCSEVTVWRRAPGRPGKIPVAPLREAFERSGMTASAVARRVGWWSDSTRTRGDGSRVLRALGLRPDNGGRSPTARTTIDAELAGALAEACGVERWEVGA